MLGLTEEMAVDRKVEEAHILSNTRIGNKWMLKGNDDDDYLHFNLLMHASYTASSYKSFRNGIVKRSRLWHLKHLLSSTNN